MGPSHNSATQSCAKGSSEILKVLRVLLFLSVCYALNTADEQVTVPQHVSKKTGESVIIVANTMYRVEGAQSKRNTPTIPRVFAGDGAPVGSLFDVSWARVESGEFHVVESGPLRVMLAGKFRVLRAGDESTVDILRMRVEH